MKRFLLPGICIVSFFILATSCNLFGSKDPLSAKDIEGKWKIDSVALSADSAKNNVGSLLLAMAIAEKQDIQVEFRTDTVYTWEDGYITEQSHYTYIPDKKEVVITDSTQQRYQYKYINDSTVSLQDKDSMVLFLKKVK